MKSRVSNRLNEGATGPVYYPAADIVAALNEGQRQFALLTLCLEKTASWTPAAYATHLSGVFSDLIAVLRITNGSGARVRPATLAEISALDPLWIAATGSAAQHYLYLGADLIGLHPYSNATLQVTYARAPIALALDADVPEIPNEYHQALVAYAIYRLRQKEGGQEFEKALKYFETFLSAADTYAGYVRARNVAARYDKAPFELAKYDRSKMLNFRPGLMPATEAADGTGKVTEVLHG